MKRYRQLIFICCLLCMLPLSLFAQLQDERHNLSVGINGGVNLNSVSFTPSIKQTNFIAPEFGLTVRYISEKYFKMICGIQGEINFSQRGWKEVIEDGSNNTYHRAMNYIEVPLLAHLAFGKQRKWSPIYHQPGSASRLPFRRKRILQRPVDLGYHQPSARD